MLILSRVEVETLLDPDRLVEALASAMAELSAGRASVPARIGAMVPEREALLAAMPAYVPGLRVLETKLVSLFPHNTDRPTHQAAITVFDPDHGTPVALLDGTSITVMRTAAGSALATRLLAREDATTLAVIGTGVQARAHASVVVRVRPFRRVLIAGRSPEKVAILVDELSSELALEVGAAPSIEEAVREADVVCAATHAQEPIVRRNWLRPGTHVNSVGYNTSGRGEVEGEAVAAASVFVESRAAALAPLPSGAVELVNAIRDGSIPGDHIRAEIGEVVAGTVRGRTSADEITLYKSVGVAVQDAAAAALVLQAARQRGMGTEVNL